MIEVGKYAHLRIKKILKQGAYLTNSDDNTEILLPKKYIPQNAYIDDEIEVFIYRDSEDKLIATTEKPYAIVGEFAYLKAKSIEKYGAFLDWGLKKDLLLPFREQSEKIETGKRYLVRIYVDKLTDRIVATQHINKFLRNNTENLSVGDKTDILICHKTQLGYKVIVNNLYWGMIYFNQIFRDIRTGERTQAWITKIREDGYIDLSLQKSGMDEINDVEEKIMKKLRENGGILPLSDNSKPDEIYLELEISKKVFKKTIGKLFKEKKIFIDENEIRLL